MKRVGYALFALFIILPFQNCGKPYQIAMREQASQVAPVVDSQAPNLIVIAPLAGLYVQSQVGVSGTCESGLPVEASVGPDKISGMCASGMFNLLLPLTVADGSLVVRIEQKDTSNNSAVSEVGINKDNVAPAVNLTSPANNATVNTASVALSGTCENGLKVNVAGSAFAASASLDCINGAFSDSLVVSNLNGTKTFSISQKDSAGNLTSKTYTLQVSLPAGSPSIRISSPAAGSILRSNPTLTGTCESGLAVSIAGSGVAAASQTACTAGAFSAAITFSAGDGLKTVTVSQTNSLNQTGQDARSFTLDTTAPAIAILSPAAGAQSMTGLTIAGSCETGLNVSVAGAGVAAAKTAACTAAQFQVAIDFTAGAGTKIVMATQVDAAGNMGSSSRSFERVAPAQLNGAQLYANNCAGCHRPLATSAKLNRNFAEIKSAIANENSMKSIVLTDPEIQAIAAALSTAPPANSGNLFAAGAYGKADLRRLTQNEITNTLTNALTLSPAAYLAALPDDQGATIYFDNEAGTQPISNSVIESYRSFATTYATAFASNTARIASVAGCTPATVADRACFITFAQKVGRRLLRRPITAAQAGRYADVLLPFATADNRFGAAIEHMLRVYVQHPEFLYRIEGGAAVNGQIELNDFQIATRISFLLWGSGPDDALLDAAQAGQLHTEAQRLAHAQRMLADTRAKSNIQRFHGEWLGYQHIGLSPTLGNDMRLETSKLIERVVFELDQDWMKLLTWNETYLTPQLATNYGVPGVTAAGWVPYTGQRGGGVLSHGTFAALGAKFGDTSPTLRGYEVFKRLMCGKLGQIPAGVDTDNPPGLPGQCKTQNYTMRTTPACMGCHTITDNIGFGLENMGNFGQWRTTENGLPNCSISGNGSVQMTTFNGPRELGALLAADTTVSSCATRQLFRFMSGRLESTADEPTLAALSAQYQQTKTLSSLLLAMVKSQAIMFKGAP